MLRAAMTNLATTNRPSRRDEVRAYLAKGLKVREIAAVMHISTQGVYDHLRKIKAEDAEREEGAA